MTPRMTIANKALLAKMEAMAGPGDTLPSLRDMAISLGVDQHRIRGIISRQRTHGRWPYTLARSSLDCRTEPLADDALAARLVALREARQRAVDEGRAFSVDEVF